KKFRPLFIGAFGVGIDVLPFLLLFERGNQPIEAADDGAKWGHVGQPARSPRIKCGKQNAFSAGNGDFIILAERLRLERTSLRARPSWRLEEICPASI